MSIIEVDKLNFSYGESCILSDISFALEKNTFTAMIGPNGGGKTTLLKLLMGFIKASSGTISLDGLSPEKAITTIGYVPQRVTHDLFFPITTLELILLGSFEKAKAFGRYPKTLIEKASSLIETLHLQDHMHKPFGSLSGGLMQRAMIAKALISDPKFLFLDEPTANIDPKIQNEIFEIIYSLKKTLTVLMVTHDLNAVLQNVEKVISINRTADILLPKDVCAHFAKGLYHTPLLKG